MPDLIGQDDRSGEPPGTRHRLPSRPGAHVAYAEGSDLIVEWYDFGDHAPYESANLLIFRRLAQEALAAALDAPRPAAPDALAARIAARFASYFDVKAFAEARGIRFTSKVDFRP
jgi:hypothetical protein